MESKRKMGRKSYGGYRLISVKDPGCPWEGVLWVKAKSLKEFDAMSDEEQNGNIINRCPFDVPTLGSFPTDYPYVRDECKSIPHDHELQGDSRNCVFLFRYADTSEYNCRLRVKNDKERIYERR